MSEMGQFRKPRSATTSNLDDPVNKGHGVPERRTSFLESEGANGAGTHRKSSNPFTWRFRGHKRKSTDFSTTSLAQAQKTNMVNNTRPVFTQGKFDEGFGMAEEDDGFDLKARVRKCVTCECSKKCWKEKLYQYLPFIAIMKAYSPRDDLFGDIIAGLTVGIMNIPQGKSSLTLCKLPLPCNNPTFC